MRTAARAKAPRQQGGCAEGEESSEHGYSTGNERKQAQDSATGPKDIQGTLESFLKVTAYLGRVVNRELSHVVHFKKNCFTLI